MLLYRYGTESLKKNPVPGTEHDLALFYLGVMHFTGEGVPKNPIRALIHFRYAHELYENQDAKRNYDAIAKALPPEVLEEVEDLSEVYDFLDPDPEVEQEIAKYDKPTKQENNPSTVTSNFKSSLPKCKNSPYENPKYWSWTDCWGTHHRPGRVTKFKHYLVYVGEFKDAQYHGRGTYYETDTGFIYQGTFACGNIAVVTEISPNGTKRKVDMTDDLPSTCKRELVFAKQTTGLDKKEKADMKRMSDVYQNYHPLELCHKSGILSKSGLSNVQKQVNKILKGMALDFTEPKRSKSNFEKLKDVAWDHSLIQLEKERNYQMAQFLGLGKENLKRDVRKKLKPMCSVYTGQLDRYESIVDMAYREERNKTGVEKKRNF